MKAGDVVLVKFPFANLKDTKKRPALFIKETDGTRGIHLVTFAMITSLKGLDPMDGDCVIRSWQSAGLLKPSCVRIAKIATVDGEIIEKKLGKLSAEDFKTVCKRVKSFFNEFC